MASISVLIADGHRWVRKGLCDLLESSPEFRVVAEAENGEQTLDLFTRYQPDVILIDLMIPDLGGLEAAKTIKQSAANARIILLNVYEDAPDMKQVLLHHDIDGFLPKTCDLVDLQDAVRRVNQGCKVYMLEAAECTGAHVGHFLN